jgi:phosphatidylserine decarboxylase
MTSYSWPEAQKQTAFPIAREGVPIIFAATFATAVFALLGLTVAALIGLAATLFICYFFRDPDRVVPTLSGAVVSPADGKVLLVETVDGGEFYSGRCLKISIFMSVFNVHVNRAAHEGRISRIAYHPGKFVSANRDKASSDNERNAVFMETTGGAKMCIVQIAGLIARRIICRVQAGDELARGQRFGLICFGSRVDLYLPEETRPNVAVGDRVSAGHSVVGYLP